MTMDVALWIIAAAGILYLFVRFVIAWAARHYKGD
jgi:hypothetical protein